MKTLKFISQRPKSAPFRITMSDYVPFEIQVDIIRRLPVKSLLRFRSVSKLWKSLIDSCEFIAGYQTHPQQQQRLLVRYTDPVSAEYKFVSFVDDETLAIQEFSSSASVLDKHVMYAQSVVGSSHGLICLYSYPRNFVNNMKPMTEMVLWNPSIRKSIAISVNIVLGWPLGQTIVGFGVCPTINDPTIVMFTHPDFWPKHSSTSTNISVPWVVEVFSLSSGTWRIASGKPPGGKFALKWGQVVIDKFIYLQSFNMILKRNVIISYDMTTEEIGVIELPDSLAVQQFYCNSFIYKLCESLAVLEYSRNKNTNTQVCDVWRMDGDAPNLFTKLFTINTPNWDLCTCHRSRALGFTKSGETILARQVDYEKQAALVVYKPGLEHIKDIGIYGRADSFYVGSYMETLLLHDQVDGRVYTSEVNKS